MRTGTYALSLALLMTLLTSQAEPVRIDGGWFASPVLLNPEQPELWVPAFKVDANPVTQEDYRHFVLHYPHWQRDRAPALFRDDNYLKHWSHNTGFDPEVINPEQAVTHVSWYAAQAYCRAQGGRLPRLNEWEYLSVLYRQAKQVSDEAYATDLFRWYNHPEPHSKRAVAQVPTNALGVNDVHGLVLEWVEDFELLLTQGDDISPLKGSCGDTARLLSNYDNASYATFLRYQSRSNYTPRTATSTLGFRCAYDLEMP